MSFVSVVVVVHHRDPALRRCLDSVLASSGVAIEVLVVANGDDVRDLVPADARVRLERTENRGFSAGCHAGVRLARGDVLVFLNPDTVVAPGALAAFVGALDDPEVGIASGRVRLAQEPDRLNAAGVAVHFLGLGWARRCGEPVDASARPEPVAAPSGAAMAMRREVWDRLGGLTEAYFLYHEDAELGIRCWLAGLRVLCVPAADVLHSYDFSRHPAKFRLLERNRLCLVLCCYQYRTLLLLLPALLVYELGMLALAVAQGWGREKWWGWAWLVRHRAWVVAHRRALARRRRRPDRELVPLLATRFGGSQVALPRALVPGDVLLQTYWRAVARLL